MEYNSGIYFVIDKNSGHKIAHLASCIFFVSCILLFATMISVPAYGDGESQTTSVDIYNNIRMWTGDELTSSRAVVSNEVLNEILVADNIPPSVGNLHIIVIITTSGQEIPGGTPITGNKLKAGYTFHDDDGDSEGNSIIRWYKDGVLVSGEQSKTLSRTVNKGERWHFSVTPSDGKSFGETKRLEFPVVVGNAPPRVQYARVLPSQPTSMMNSAQTMIISIRRTIRKADPRSGGTKTALLGHSITIRPRYRRKK